MNQKPLIATLAIALASLSANAAAVPLLINGSVADGTRLLAGQRSGTFAASGLPDFYRINNASFSFTFNDDSDGMTSGPIQQTSASYGAYALEEEFHFVNWWSNTQVVRDFVRYGTVSQWYERTGQQEGVALTLAGQAAGSGSTALQKQTLVNVYRSSRIDNTVRWGPQGNYSCGNGCTAYGPLNTDYYWSYPDVTATIHETDWKGSFTIAGTITDRAILDTLFESGSLSFNLAVTGDLLLSSSQLNLDYDELAPPPSAGVPEPSTVWLLAGALGAMACNRRRKADRR